MNVIIGRIYKAPWGRYVGHREGVLRSLDNSGAFSVQPHADDFIDTGEDLAPVTNGWARTGPEADGCPVPAQAAVEAVSGSERRALDVTARETAIEREEVPSVTAGETAPTRDPRTLGGLRPGSIYCVVPGMPQLEWKQCLSRAEDGTGSHVYFLESTDHLSLFCGPCRARRPLSFVGHKKLVAHINALVAAGKIAEARGIAEGTRAPRVDNIDELEEIAEAPPVVELKITDHCCPRIVLGHGLHSPACKNFVANAEPVMPAIPRDDPKAEAGSFERVVPWRPKYRDRADWDEWRHERAAIFEYEGGVSRKYAEIAANRLAGPPP